MEYFTHTFANGLRIIHFPSLSPVSYCGFGINAGARDEETENQFGLAHFVEHLLFKGTERRKSWHILNCMEKVGGELNAFTTKEETFVYSVFMDKDFRRATDLLHDLVFNSRFPQTEIDKEVDVILDEINTYNDTPSELIYDEFENHLFSGHSLGHNILGEEKSLTTFTTATGLSFLKRFYSPANMIFFSVGQIPFRTIIRMLEAKGMEDAPAPALPQRTPPPAKLIIPDKTITRNTHQTHIMIGGRSFNMFEYEKRLPLFLLNNILGGPGMNSRLNVSLREKHGLVYTVESGITSYTDIGLAAIYLGTSAKHASKAIGLVRKELANLRSVLLTDARLSAAKKQAIGQLSIGIENRESLFLNIGKAFLHHNRYEALPEIARKIEKITAGEIIDTANEIFSDGNLFTLVFE